MSYLLILSTDGAVDAAAAPAVAPLGLSVRVVADATELLGNLSSEAVPVLMVIDLQFPAKGVDKFLWQVGRTSGWNSAPRVAINGDATRASASEIAVIYTRPIDWSRLADLAAEAAKNGRR